MCHKGLASVIGLAALTPHPRVARAEDATETRLRALEQQLQKALSELDRQREATSRAQRQIDELRSQLGRQAAAPARSAPRGLAKAPQPSGTIEETVKQEVARSQAET